MLWNDLTPMGSRWFTGAEWLSYAIINCYTNLCILHPVDGKLGHAVFWKRQRLGEKLVMESSTGISDLWSTGSSVSPVLSGHGWELLSWSLCTQPWSELLILGQNLDLAALTLSLWYRTGPSPRAQGRPVPSMVGAAVMAERMVMVASHLPKLWDLACPAQTGTAAESWGGRGAVVAEVLGYPRWERLEASVPVPVGSHGNTAILAHWAGTQMSHTPGHESPAVPNSGCDGWCLGCLLRAVFPGMLGKRRWDGVLAELCYL